MFQRYLNGYDSGVLPGKIDQNGAFRAPGKLCYYRFSQDEQSCVCVQIKPRDDVRNLLCSDPGNNEGLFLTGIYATPLLRRALASERQRFEQYRTSCQQRAHFLRQLNGRSQ